MTTRIALCLASAWISSAAAATPAPLFSTPAERCIIPASTYHTVNPYVLRAILRVESGLKPHARNQNENGTYDLGMGQMNSMHFGKLKQHGIAPSDLLDGCIATYVAAWHLSGIIRQHGNTWEAIARYHSGTPYFNRRYQVLLHNELVRSGVMSGNVLPVPPMKPHGSTRQPTSATAAGAPSSSSTTAGAVVFDRTDP